MKAERHPFIGRCLPSWCVIAIVSVLTVIGQRTVYDWYAVTHGWVSAESVLTMLYILSWIEFLLLFLVAGLVYISYPRKTVTPVQ